MKKYFLNLAKVLLVGATFAAVGCTDYDEDIQKTNDRIDDVITNQIDPLKVDLQKAVADLTAAQAALKNEILAAHKADIDKLTAALEAITNAKKTGRLDVVEGAVADLQKDVAALEAADKAFAEELAKKAKALEDAIKANSDKIEANYTKLVAYVDAEIESLEKEIAAINTKIATIEASIKTLQETKLDVADFETYKAEVKKLYDALVAADEALQGQVDGIKLELKKAFGLIEENRKDIAQLIVASEKHRLQIAKNMEAIAALQEKDVELEKEIAENAAQIATLDGALTKLRNEYDAYKKVVDEALANLTKDVEALDGRLTIAEGDIDKLEAADEVLKKAIADTKAALEGQIADLKKLVLERVESLVYVPDYDDGKATINYGILRYFIPSTDLDDPMPVVKEKVIEALTTIYYQVYPVDAAATVVAASAENPAAVLAFNLQEVRIRPSSDEAVPALNIVKVELPAAKENMPKGTIKLTVAARHLGDAFYLGEASWSAALALVGDEVNANISSVYTNLVPADVEDAEEIKVGIYNTIKEKTVEITGECEAAHEIEYTRREGQLDAVTKEPIEPQLAELVKGHYVGYQVGNKIYKPSQFVAAGYHWGKDANAVIMNCVNVSAEYFDAEGKADEKKAALFNWRKHKTSWGSLTFKEDAKDTFVNYFPVSQTTLTKDAVEKEIGSKMQYTIAYTVLGDVLLETYSEVVVGKDLATVQLNANDIVWNYELDAQYDKESLENSSAYKSARFGYDINIVASELDAVGLSLVDVIKADKNKGKVVFASDADNKTQARIVFRVMTKKVDGKDVEYVAANINNFEWDKTYTLKDAKYETENISASISFTFNTVDRVREVLKYTESTDLVMATNLTKTFETKLLATVFDDLVATSANFGVDAEGKAAFLAEILGDNALFVANKQTVTGFKNDDQKVSDEGTAETNITINTKGDAAVANYSYVSFTEFIPQYVTIVKEITLWYGQKVVLTYNIDLAFPDVNYDFQHHKAYVFYDEAKALYASQAQAAYFGTNLFGQLNNVSDKTTTRLKKIEIIDVDMDDAFYVVSTKSDYIENIAELGLSTSFDFVTAPKDNGIVFNGNKLAYNGKDDVVKVRGTLTLSNTKDNTASIVLPTSFDGEGRYSTYEVRKFDPLTDLYSTNKSVVITEPKVYTFGVLDLFDIYESREGNGEAYVIKHGVTGNDTTINLIERQTLLTQVDGYWRVGNGLDGWAPGVSVYELFNDFSYEFNDIAVQIPTIYKKFISWNPDTNQIIFDNSNNILLQEDVPVKVKLTVDYVWAEKSAEAVLTFKADK